MRSLFLLLLGIVVAHCQQEQAEPVNVEVTKCCAAGEFLDTTDPGSPTCTARAGGEQPALGSTTGLDLTKDIGSRNVSISLQVSNTKMPNCQDGRKSLTLGGSGHGEAWVTVQGRLVVTDLQHQLRHHQFCVDWTDLEARVLGAVTCSPCTKGQGHPCVNLCCPHGQAYVKDGSKQLEICSSHQNTTNESPFSSKFWAEHDARLKEWEDEHGIILKAPTNSSGFQCQEGVYADGLHWYPNHTDTLDHYRIEDDGRLYGQDIDYPININGTTSTKHGNHMWETNQFCVSYADAVHQPDSDDYHFDEQMGLTYMTCYDARSCEETNTCTSSHKYNNVFKPTAICISIFFFLLTLGAYIWSDNLNLNDLSSRMTIAFVVNVTIASCVSLDQWLKKDINLPIDPPVSCFVSGYFFQYFWLCYLFWISAMGFNIWRTINGHTSNAKLLPFYALYAQGMPLLICVITAIVDTGRPLRDGIPGRKITAYYPNMAQLRCFVGENQDDKVSYFSSAQFIYCDMFVCIIQTANIFFLGSIWLVLRKGWESQAKVLELQGSDTEDFQDRFKKARQQTTIVIRLFVILGVPLGLEILASIITYEYKLRDGLEMGAGTEAVVFFSEFCTFLSGILIFVTLIVKKKLMRGMKTQAARTASRMGLTTITSQGEEMTQMSQLSKSGDSSFQA